MSVYSGFATRLQQNAYDNILFNVVSLLSLRLVKFYRGGPVEDEGFFKLLNTYHRHLRKMEKQKYMDPKYSPILSSLLHKLIGETTEMSERSLSQKEFPKIDKSLTINVEPPSTRGIEREANSEKTVSLERIVERVKKRKNKKGKSKRSSVMGEVHDTWQLKEQRMPVIQRFRFNSDDPSPDRSRYNWASEITKDVEMVRSGTMGKVQIHEESIKRITNGARFRTNMYFK